MERVIPLSRLIWLWGAWLSLDVVDCIWLHWFTDDTPIMIAHKFYFMAAIIFAGWLLYGRTVSNEAAA